MDHKAISFLLLAALCRESTPEPSPQFQPSGFHREPSPRGASQRRDSSFGESRHWTQTLHNYSSPAPNFDFLDPASSPVADEILKTKVPRQSGFYGAPNPQYQFGYGGRNQNPFAPPPPPVQPSGYPGGYSQGFSPGYPQIYKVDNLIIIANPPQQQACTQPLQPLDPNAFPGSESTLDNRFGNDEPTKCTWAIVACCAPGNQSVRYNCFELMGCAGMFVDQLPCTPAIVDAATRAALAFYRNANNNATGTVTDNNRV